MGLNSVWSSGSEWADSQFYAPCSYLIWTFVRFFFHSFIIIVVTGQIRTEGERETLRALYLLFFLSFFLSYE